MSDARYRIEHGHLDEVSVLGFSDEVTAGRHLDLLRQAHASGVVVVIGEGTAEAVGWYPLWPVEPETTAVRETVFLRVGIGARPDGDI